MRKNHYKIFPPHTITNVNLPLKSRFLIGSLMDIRGYGQMMLFIFFPPFRSTLAVTFTRETLAIQVTKKISIFFKKLRNNHIFYHYITSKSIHLLVNSSRGGCVSIPSHRHEKLQFYRRKKPSYMAKRCKFSTLEKSFFLAENS